MSSLEFPNIWDHPEYTAREITTGRWTTKPKIAVQVSFPPTGDIFKSRACSILEQFKPYYSHRLGYVVSPKKFAKFQAAMEVKGINQKD